MTRVIFAPLADRDLEAIADYIAADNPARAVTFVQDIRRRCAGLAAAPRSARRFPELGPDAHILPFGNYVILYRALADEVSIERVIHGARDIMALISAGE
jgi:toxin ParE1/3/4